MKRIILTYGLIAGFIVTFNMFLAIIFGLKDIDFGLGETLGYTIMIVAFSMVFIGIKAFRDKHLQGEITFGKGLIVGLYITLIASAMYCAVWELYLATSDNDFMTSYTTHYLEKMKEEGASSQEIADMKIEMDSMTEMYKNPLLRVGITFMEIFPVGLIISLICAGVLQRKEVLPAGNSIIKTLYKK